MSRARLDEELVARGLYASRARARDAVLRGTVTVNGAIIVKPAAGVAPSDDIQVADAARAYVSRSALKLSHALDYFGLSVAGCHALDIGASTGGFTQVLLERGAAHVTAIDAGHGQLADMLKNDPRVTSTEGLNARDLTRDHLTTPVDLVVCDVSFISLELAIPQALGLAEAGAQMIALIKPQFEVGRSGNPHDVAQHHTVCERITLFLQAQGWRVQGLTPSPLTGSDGSQEFLIAARKH